MCDTIYVYIYICIYIALYMTYIKGVLEMEVPKVALGFNTISPRKPVIDLKNGPLRIDLPEKGDFPHLLQMVNGMISPTKDMCIYI